MLCTVSALPSRAFMTIQYEVSDRVAVITINRPHRAGDPQPLSVRAAGPTIDAVYRNGYGIPAHRGGPLFFGETLGLEHVLHSTAAFPGGYQLWFWEPAPQLVDAVPRGVDLIDT
jgi:hypothetical protein